MNPTLRSSTRRAPVLLVTDHLVARQSRLNQAVYGFENHLEALESRRLMSASTLSNELEPTPAITAQPAVKLNYSVNTDPSTDQTSGLPRKKAPKAAPPEGNQISRLVLVNARSRKDITTLEDGQTVDLAQFGVRKISVRAEGGSETKSVVFSVNEKKSKTDSSKKYALRGGKGGKYHAWRPSIGEHTLTVTPYTRNRATGTAGEAVTVHFLRIKAPAKTPPVDTGTPSHPLPPTPPEWTPAPTPPESTPAPTPPNSTPAPTPPDSTPAPTLPVSTPIGSGDEVGSVDSTAPVAQIVEIAPDPRAVSVDSITINFSEVVTGFDLSDMRLTRDGGENLLTSLETDLASIDGRTYTVSNLSSITAAPGTYTLSVTGDGSGIADGSGNPLASDASDSWTMTVPPTILSWASTLTHGPQLGEVGLTVPDDGSFVESRSGGVSKLLVRFDHPIDPATFTPTSVLLAGNGHAGSLDLSDIAISTSLVEDNKLGLISFSTALPNAGKYLVRLSGIAGPAGLELTGDADRVFTTLAGDVSGDGRVNAADLSRIRGSAAGFIVQSAPTQVRADVSMDGAVDETDWLHVRDHNGNHTRGIQTP